MDSEDSAPIKMFLLVWVRRQATAAHGDHRWSWVVKKKVLGFGWAFGEEETEKKLCFSH